MGNQHRAKTAQCKKQQHKVFSEFSLQDQPLLGPVSSEMLQMQHFPSHPEPTQDGEEAIRSSRKASKPELGQDGHMPATATQRTLRGTHTGVRAMPMSSLDEDQFTSGDRRGPADSARKSAATKPRSRAHVWANRFPMTRKTVLLALLCQTLFQTGRAGTTPKQGDVVRFKDLQ